LSVQIVARVLSGVREIKTMGVKERESGERKRGTYGWKVCRKQSFCAQIAVYLLLTATS